MKIITMSGNIGVGKTTLGKLLALEIDALWLPEDAFSKQFDNLVAQKNPTIRVIMQMAFSVMRVATLLSGVLAEDVKTIVVERNLRDCLVFHKVWRKMTGLEQYDGFFSQFYDLLSHNISYEEYVIWLNCPIDILNKRIADRGTHADMAHTVELITQLDQEYNFLYSQNQTIDHLKIDTGLMTLDEDGLSQFFGEIKTYCGL